MERGSGEGLERGESPNASSQERAAYWVEFYERLVAFETEILATMESLSARFSEEEARAVELTNIGPMRELIADFERRASIWREVD